MRFAEIEIIHRVLKNEPTFNIQGRRQLVVTLVVVTCGYCLGYCSGYWVWLLFDEVHTRSNLITFTSFQVAEL